MPGSFGVIPRCTTQSHIVAPDAPVWGWAFGVPLGWLGLPKGSHENSYTNFPEQRLSEHELMKAKVCRSLSGSRTYSLASGRWLGRNHVTVALGIPRPSDLNASLQGSCSLNVGVAAGEADIERRCDHPTASCMNKVRKAHDRSCSASRVTDEI